MPSSLEPSSGVVTEILQDDIFFSARSSSNSFKQAPRQPTEKPKDAGVGIRPLYILIARTLANHARGDVSMTKHVHALRTLDST